MNRTLHPVDKEEVMAYLDGELAAERAANVGAHIEQCSECQALAADLGGLSQQVLAWQVGPAPEGLTEHVAAAAHTSRPQFSSTVRPSTTRSGWFVLRRWSFATAIALAALVLVIGVHELYQAEVSRVSELAERATGLSGPGPSDRYAALTVPVPMPVGHPSSGGGGGGRVNVASREFEVPNGPIVVQTASLTIVAQKLDEARTAMEQAVSRHQGYVAELTVNERASFRTLTATLRVPSNQLDATLADLSRIGHVEEEHRSVEDVTRRYVDQMARLKNARATEQRLIELLQQRTGKISEVLEVEKGLSSVREEIESMEAEHKSLEKQVEYAAIKLQLDEEYRAELGGSQFAARTRLRNALVAGYRTLVDNVLGLASFLLNYGLSILFWVLILFWPARWAWRRVRATAQ